MIRQQIRVGAAERNDDRHAAALIVAEGGG